MADNDLKRLLEGLLSDIPLEIAPREAIPEQISVSAESPDSLRRLERHALRLQTASQVSHAASSILDLDELLPQVVNLIRRQFGFYYVGIFLVDEDQEWAVLQAGTDKAGQQMIEQGHKLKIGGDSMIGWSIAHRQARIALDVGEEAVRFDNPLLPDTRSEMALPLISRGRVIGAMTVQSAEASAFSDEDASALQSMADQLANAIENARLFQERERRLTELAIVNEIGQAISSSLDMDSLLETVHRQVSRLFDTTNFYVATYDEATDEWLLRFHLEGGQRQPPARYSAREGLTGYIIRSRQPVLLRSVDENMVFKQTHGVEIIGEMASSWLGVPLIAADNVVGAMAIQNYQQEHLYDASDLGLFSTIAAQVANALESLHLLEETRRRAREMEVIIEVGRAITSVLDVGAVLRQIVDITKARFGHYFVSIALVEGEQILFRYGSTIGKSNHCLQDIALDVNLDGGVGLIAEAVRTGRPLLANDVLNDPRYLALAELQDTRSELVVPIEVKGQVIGVLDVQSDRPFAYQDTDVVLLQSLVSQAGIAIENARLFQERERRIADLAIVNEIGRAVSVASSLDELLDMVYERVSRLFETTDFYIAVYEEASAEWVVALEVQRAERQPPGRYQVDTGLTGHIIRNRQPLLLRDLGEFLAFSENQGVDYLDEPARSWLGVPLIAADRVVGVMAIQDYDHDNLYDDQDMALFSTIAAQVANAQENLRLLMQTRRRAQEMEALNEAGRAVTSVLDLDAVLRRIVDTTKERFGHFFVGILLLEGNQLVFRSGSLVGDSEVRWERGDLRLDLDGHGLTVAVATCGQSILVNDVRTDSRYGTAPGLEPVQSELDTPIVVKGHVIGVLTVQSDRLHAFDQADVVLLQSLADQAAVAIENAQLFEETRSRAEEMSVLNEMSRALSARLDVDAALYNLYRYASQLMDTSSFYVALYDAETDETSFPLAVEDKKQVRWASRRSGQGLTEYLLRTREPLLIGQDVQGFIREHLEGVQQIGREAQSWLGVPMVIGEQMVGVIVVQSYAAPWQYNERHQEVLSAMARQAAIAIENARLFAHAQQSAQRAQALYETSRALSSYLEEEPVMHTILEAVYRALACEFATISIADEEAGFISSRHIIWQGQFDVFPEWIAMVRYPLDHPDITADVYRSGKTEIIGDWDERFNREIWDRFGHERFLRVFMPIKLQDRVIGVIEVGYDKEQKGSVDEEDVQLLTAFVDQAAIALQNARLFEQARSASAQMAKRVQELDSLNEIGRQIDEAPPIPELLRWVADHIPPAMQYPDLCVAAVKFEGDVYGSAQAMEMPRQMVHGLYIGGEQVGQVCIAYVEDREFLDEESALLGDVARRVSGYIENRRLFQQTQDALIDTQLSQAALREVMELQTAIVENADYALISTTPEGTIMTFNRAAEQMLGYRAEDLIGEATPGIFHDPEEVVARAAIFSEDLGYTIEPGFEVFVARARHNLPNRYEWTYICKDGSRLPVLLAVSALRDTQDNITGFLGIAQDITARKAAEAERERLLVELQQSQEFLSSLLDNVPNPIFVKNVQGVYIECNQAFLDYLGSAREEIIGKSVYDLQTDKSLADRYHEMDMVLFRSRGQQIYESRVKYADGTFHDVIFNKATFNNPDGSVGGLIGTIVDISDRKRAEAQRERLLAQTETLYSVSLDLIAAGNPEEMLQAIATPALATGANAATLMYVDSGAEGQPEWAEVIAILGNASTPVGTRGYLTDSPQASLLLADPDRPLLINDLGKPHESVDEQIVQMVRATGTRALVVIPLRAGQRWEGIVTLTWPEPHDFSPEEEQLYSVAGSQLAIAIQGLRLRQQAEHRAVWLQTSSEVSRAASTILDPDELMRRSVELVRDRFDLYYAGLFLVDQRGHDGNGAGNGEGWAVLRVATGEAGRQMVQQGHRLKIGGESMIGQCLANKQPRVAMDVGHEAVRFDNPLLPDTRTELALPLISRGQPMGALSIQSERPAAFTAEDIAVLQTMADQLATTIDNAHLIEQSSRQAERERLTRTITDRVRRGTDREAIMRVALEELSEMLGASTSVVRLGTREQLLSTVQSGLHERKEKED
jgi:PAS domain S-box-containing protein